MSQPVELHLGYEIGTGQPVSIPLRNMVVTGQTQEAGKTTTLEALVKRATAFDIAAIAFVTKRGESAFMGFRSGAPTARMRPYFRERADWQFVASVLEATMRERMKFERSWIIQASKGATTLADVHLNVKRLLTKAKGLTESVYITLDAYLDIVVPRISVIHWAETLELHPGINVMDISDREHFPSEIQALVIRSVLEAIYQGEHNTIAILPEAWEFLPQERGSPVKLAATELVRKGSSLRNYVWLDSQDIGGVDKTMLRSCPVWLLGVQREANEIKRMLDNIPAGIKKPKAGEIATLEKGQFFACHGKSVVKTYVQPSWMSAKEAKEIALHPDQAAEIIMRAQRTAAPAPKETPPVNDANATAVIKALEQQAQRMGQQNERLDKMITLMERGPTVVRDPLPPAAEKSKPGAIVQVHEHAGNGAADLEQVYQFVKDRLVREAPKILAVGIDVPEIEIRTKKVVIETDVKTAHGMIAMLLHEGFLDAPIKANAVWGELKRRWNYQGNSARAYEQLDKLTATGFVRKEADGYSAVPGMKKRIRTVEE